MGLHSNGSQITTAQMAMKEKDDRRLNVEESPWDLCDFFGRWEHYQWITDPRLSVAGPACEDQARELLRLYHLKKEPSGTTPELVAFAKRLYESSVHPDTGCRIPVSARLSSMPMIQMVLTAAMVSFCRTMPAVWFWQLVHNGYHAYVNLANGNGTAPRTRTEQAVTMGSAAMTATIVTVPFKTKLSQAFCRSRLRNFVPLTVVLLSQAVNVPLARQNELFHGVDVFDRSGELCGTSRTAAAKGICQVALSRMLLFTPSMFLVPLVTPILERRSMIWGNRWLLPTVQVLLSTALITIMIPVSCAVFPQSAHVKTESLRYIDPELHEKVVHSAVKRKKPIPTQLYFNKGL